MVFARKALKYVGRIEWHGVPFGKLMSVINEKETARKN